jgi:hypothetical protein
VDHRLRSAFNFGAARLAVFGIILVQGFAASLDETPVTEGYQRPIRELAGFPVTELGHDILGNRPVPIKLAIEHPIASLGKGGRASAPKVGELVPGDFALDDTPPFLRFVERPERFGLGPARGPGSPLS